MLVMTSVLARTSSSATARPTIDALQVLATEALRSALERHGCTSTASHVELRRVAGQQIAVVAFVSPQDPWQATMAALADSVHVVRMFDPMVRLAEPRFEPIETDQRSQHA